MEMSLHSMEVVNRLTTVSIFTYLKIVELSAIVTLKNVMDFTFTLSLNTSNILSALLSLASDMFRKFCSFNFLWLNNL